MLKIFWGKDNIVFIGDRVDAAEHSHCVLQAFLSLDAPLSVTVGNKKVSGKCIIVNKNVRHSFSCENKIRLSILIEPCSAFAKELLKRFDGDYLIFNDESEDVRHKAAALLDTDDKQRYIEFIRAFKEYAGIKNDADVSDERITQLLELLQNCDCYDHTIDGFAKSVSLSSSRLSHLFREQIGVPLKSYIQFHQLEKAFTALLNGANITDAAMCAGFDSPSHFAATVKKWMGMSAGTSIKDSEFLKVFI